MLPAIIHITAATATTPDTPTPTDNPSPVLYYCLASTRRSQPLTGRGPGVGLARPEQRAGFRMIGISL